MNDRRTERLLLRRWRDDDRAPFAAMNADPAVMEYFPSTSDRRESDALVDHIEAHFDTHGFGLWVVEIPDVSSFVGFVGLSVPTFDAHFMPATEIGWRFARHAWGHGYATESARVVLAHAFEELELPEVVSFTAVGNTPSRRVMERIGMTHDPADDFDHPRVPVASPWRRHVLYRLARPGPAFSPPAA